MPENQSGQNPEIERIITQYRKVVGAFEEMFQAISPRTSLEWWRSDGIGSCRGGSRHEGGLKGDAASQIINLRDARNLETAGEKVEDSIVCPYHRKNFGCVLGDLKSPQCIAWIDEPAELDERFGINGSQLRRHIDKVTKDIFAGGDNEDLVDKECEYAKQLTEYIKGFPLTGEPDGNSPVFVQSEYA